MLQHGGNAIDAAVTAAAVLAVVEPMMTGIGGDMFAIIWSAKEKKLVALNASGRAGSLMTREELVKRGRTRMPSAASRASRCPARSPDGTRCSRSTARSRWRRPSQPAIGYAEKDSRSRR